MPPPTIPQIVAKLRKTAASIHAHKERNTVWLASSGRGRGYELLDRYDDLKEVLLYGETFDGNMTRLSERRMRPDGLAAWKAFCDECGGGDYNHSGMDLFS